MEERVLACEKDAVPVWLALPVPVWVDDVVPDCEGDAVPVCEDDAVPVCDDDAVPVCEDDAVPLCEGDALPDCTGDEERLVELEADAELVCVAVADKEEVPVAAALDVVVPEMLMEGVPVDATVELPERAPQLMTGARVSPPRPHAKAVDRLESSAQA